MAVDSKSRVAWLRRGCESSSEPEPSLPPKAKEAFGTAAVSRALGQKWTPRKSSKPFHRRNRSIHSLSRREESTFYKHKIGHHVISFSHSSSKCLRRVEQEGHLPRLEAVLSFGAAAPLGSKDGSAMGEFVQHERRSFARPDACEKTLSLRPPAPSLGH